MKKYEFQVLYNKNHSYPLCFGKVPSFSKMFLECDIEFDPFNSRCTSFDRSNKIEMDVNSFAMHEPFSNDNE